MNPNASPSPGLNPKQAWKKLALVGFAVILDPGSIPQLVAAFIFSLIFMLLCAIAAPSNLSLSPSLTLALTLALT